MDHTALTDHQPTSMAGGSDAVQSQNASTLETKILPIKPTALGRFITDKNKSKDQFPLEDWELELDESSPDAQSLRIAANQLRTSDIPVAFPTETVYGLGADATRSAAVQGIYAAKQRPSDNPLIVHFASLAQLRSILRPGRSSDEDTADPLPAIYHPLIRRFWPGPLTIILPNPPKSLLAPQVTAGRSDFGARIPRNLLALALIKVADKPIAAPSANASTKPSPTAAEHVFYDLNGRIEWIVDGGPCNVGVESTVVDAGSERGGEGRGGPCILRPGGISLEQIRGVEGWEGTVVAYEDSAMKKGDKGVPRAPGMKYRHYSPRAKVVLFECGVKQPGVMELRGFLGERGSIGIVRTRRWESFGKGGVENNHADRVMPAKDAVEHSAEKTNGSTTQHDDDDPIQQMLTELSTYQKSEPERMMISPDLDSHTDSLTEGFEIYDMHIGPSTADIARGLFSALRDLDRKDVDAILVEGINDAEGHVAAAVMNRLRKAAA